MHPILFRIPLPNWTLPWVNWQLPANLPIYSYGVMLGLSLVVGWYLTLYLSERDGLPKETMANCYVVTAIAAIIGSRLLYVLTNLSEFETVGQVFSFRSGGLVAYGGFLGGYLGSWGYLKMKKIPLMPWADVAVPSLATGLAITRIGCYLFGCDFGKPLSADAPAFLQKVGTFPHWAPGTVDKGDGSPAWIQHVHNGLISPDAQHSLAVHPTQIYESLLGLALFALLMFQRKSQRFRGQVFMLFAFAYGAARFLLEIVRDDPERGSFGPELGRHVWIPLSLALFAIGYAISFARSVPNVTLQRLTQALAFVPAIVAYLALRPASFVTAELVQLSTSQWVGLATAVAVSAAFVVFWKAAEAHPESAMSLHLEGFYAQEAAKAAEGKKDDASATTNKAKKSAGRVDEAAAAKKNDDEDEESVSEPEDKPKAEVVDAAFDADEAAGAAKAPEDADPTGEKDEKKQDVVDAKFDDKPDDPKGGPRSEV